MHNKKRGLLDLRENIDEKKKSKNLEVVLLQSPKSREGTCKTKKQQ